MGETALLIFSFCMEAAIGIMLFTTLGKLLYKDKQFRIAALTAAILSVIGVSASLAHLGRPLAALNSLSNFGSSWLSREVLFAGVFMGITVLHALALYFKQDNQSLPNILRWTGSVVGLITIFSMAKLYSTASVPVWHGINTFVDLYATTIAVGALIFLVSSLKELQDSNKKIFGFIILAAVIFQAAVAVPYAVGLGSNGMAAQASAEILSEMSVAIGLKWLLILGGAGFLIWPVTQKISAKEAKPATNMIYAAGAALILGEIIGRYVFYAAMVSTGVGLT
ncbi:dimethyl sulfoxide reductase anchor subunit family protein [Desulfosporosinus youngiae]|uniref:DMSO reductase anchor subunit n=1 Tax=Desulfosporosinus youngiae DSM 17734 TaxID=768710 RepID=H5XXZ5_9FIRM|nr:DmsC/YnfH family molybdoenzyme membrane anchor subunit [Desulfosporosinus youngiae]EHQ91498.1 DMSO reductase anchor subunit [Desulfosporosinus youngiae DSM 17734]